MALVLNLYYYITSTLKKTTQTNNPRHLSAYVYQCIIIFRLNAHSISQLLILIFIIDLILKLNLEEKLLNKRFKQYKNYTSIFLPFATY